jgi:hypothetical protein
MIEMNIQTKTMQAPVQAFRELADAAQLYFDLLYTCDLELFDRIFHERAQLFTLENGTPVSRSANEYRELLRTRQSPQALGAPREDQLIDLDLASATQAFIKLRVRINQVAFLDYLTLLRLEQGWRIISKTYHRIALD